MLLSIFRKIKVIKFSYFNLKSCKFYVRMIKLLQTITIQIVCFLYLIEFYFYMFKQIFISKHIMLLSTSVIGI